MKRGVLVLFSLALVFVLSGCGNQNKEQNQEKEQNKNQEKGGMISSIKDAMGLGKTMRCVYKDKTEEGEMESVVYVKGQKYKSENVFQGKKMVGVFDGETMWSWNEGEKNGFKLTMKCTEELAQQNKNKEREENRNSEEVKVGEEAFDDALDTKCEEASDVDFSIPNDVVFVDQCEMFKGFSREADEMMKKYQGQMPEVPKGME
ncbi:MAG: hypothetical protein ACOYS2_00215 [Patescibacteria group bacterium]